MSKRAAVFLDRDGVVTVERGYITPIKEIELFPYASECVRQIHERGYLAIVITNQSGVARGLFTEKQLVRLHEKIRQETKVDAIYYCPHHPQGNISSYAISCNCRKPKTGLIERACKEFTIDRKKSYMIGDRAVDILTGISAGLKTVLLESGYGSRYLESNIKPDYVLNDLRELTAILKKVKV